MRKELVEVVNTDYWVYGHDIHEFYLVVDLIERYSNYADESISNTAQTLYTNTDAEYINAANEVSSDLAYYNYLEKGLLWSFALWRLQGIFEAMLINRFLPQKPIKNLVGLKAKLSAVKMAGYQIDTAKEDEVFLWANLGNSVSHAPPEHFSPIMIHKSDIEEYVELLVSICKALEAQKINIVSVTT